MRNLVKIGAMVVAIGCIFAFSSCKKSAKCKNSEYPYWCSSAKTCCSYKYYDGHGTCWSTMNGCRSSGYACQTCHIED